MTNTEIGRPVQVKNVSRFAGSDFWNTGFWPARPGFVSRHCDRRDTGTY